MVFAREPGFFNDQFGEDDDERSHRLARRRRDRRERERAQAAGVPTPPEGSEGLPIPASQDPLRRLY